MSKIKALDFAKYVDDNRKYLSSTLKTFGKDVKDTDSLDKLVSTTASLNVFPEEEEETEEVDLLAERTLVDNGKVVKVTYEGGTTFILNYNNFAITVDGEEIPALGFVRKN